MYRLINDIMYLKKPMNDCDKNIYSQAEILFDLREQIFKKLDSMGFIERDSDQSATEEYEESIAERTKLRRQR